MSEKLAEALKQGPITWNEFCRYIARRDRCSMSEAGSKGLKEFPEIHPINKIQNLRRAR